MTSLKPVPRAVTQVVGDYLRVERSDCKQYDNRSLLDESGVYSLHRLAADIYAMAWRDGFDVATDEARERILGGAS